MKVRIYPMHIHNDEAYDEWTSDADKITDYTVNGNLFVIRRGGAWVGIYNLDDVSRVIVEGENE